MISLRRTNGPARREPQVIVGRQREATPDGRRKLNISRSGSMGNPFVLKEHGGDCETAEEATNKYIPWLQPRLRDTSSKEYAWFEQQSERLCSGEKLILGCCGHDHCHGVWIAHLLNTGDWRRWDTIDVEDWCARAIALLVKNGISSIPSMMVHHLKATHLESQRLFLIGIVPIQGSKGFTSMCVILRFTSLVEQSPFNQRTDLKAVLETIKSSRTPASFLRLKSRSC